MGRRRMNSILPILPGMIDRPHSMWIIRKSPDLVLDRAHLEGNSGVGVRSIAVDAACANRSFHGFAGSDASHIRVGNSRTDAADPRKLLSCESARIVGEQLLS